MTPQPEDVLAQLSAAGVSVWLDDISRERLTTGNLAGLVRDRHVVGVTSNPTIFAHALASGSAYDGQLADLEVRGGGTRGGHPRHHHLRHPVGLRRAAAGLRRDQRHRRPGLDRGGPAARRGHRQDHRRGACAVVAGGPAEPVHQDPGDPSRACPRSRSACPRASASTSR